MTEEEDSGDDWEGVIMSHSSGWLCVGDGGPLESVAEKLTLGWDVEDE